MELKVIYEDDNLLVVDKPAGFIVFQERGAGGRNKKSEREKALVDLLLKKYPHLKKVGKAPRYGIIHRLDKDTSGILLVAKNNEALDFFQREFKEGKVLKKYLALVVGNLKREKGSVETLIGRSPQDKRKQKVYLPYGPKSKGKRKAITKYRLLKNFKNYSLIEVQPETGRKHQIRCHLSYLGHPIAGDKIYSFKNQFSPQGLSRQFLHASYLKIRMPDGKIKEFSSELSQDLKKVLNSLK